MKPFDPAFLDNGILLPVKATVAEMDSPSDELATALNAAIARVRQGTAGDKAVAGLSPIGSNNQPRMLQLSAWICHAGYPNGNNQGFSEAGLKAAVDAGMFAPPYMGMVDFNHDFTAIGAWYKAEYKYDEVAGAWGIFAHGAIWAWRYAEQVDRLLAMQQRNGHIDVSIACLFTEFERVTNPDTGLGWTMINNPVFPATSVLDVDPADPKSRGLGSEDPEQTEADRTLALIKAALEKTHMEELLNQIKAAIADAKSELNLQPLIDAVAALETEKVARATADASVAELTEKLAAATAALATATASLEAKTTELATLTVSAEALNATIASQNDELDALRAFKGEADARVAADAKAARDAERMAQIPEPVLAQLDIEKNEENKVLVQKWMDQSDEEWTGTVKLFAVATAARTSRAERTEREGNLSAISDADLGTSRIARYAQK